MSGPLSSDLGVCILSVMRSILLVPPCCVMQDAVLPSQPTHETELHRPLAFDK